MAIDTTVPSSKVPVRKQRIERWVYKDRDGLVARNADGVTFPMERRLNAYLTQLGEDRQRLIEDSHFDQKLFANKQALRHKDNQSILSTSNYVRRVCQYAEMNVNEARRTPTAPVNKRKKASREPNRNQMEKRTPAMASDDELQKRHVQFQRASQSANVLGKAREPLATLQSASATFTYRPSSIDSTGTAPFSRVVSPKNSLKEFRLHPERFLSKSNRYLPILRRQATSSISPFFDGSDLACEEAKSFLSEGIDGGRSTFSLPVPTAKKFRAPTKIDLMGSVVDDSSERLLALSYLRQRESAHVDSLIRSKPIEHILEPLSTIKERPTSDLRDILRSIDSLRGSTRAGRHAVRRQFETNHANLAILIF